MGTLSAFLIGIAGNLAARVFLALGIGIVSYAAVTTLLNSVISQLQGYYNSIPVTTLQLANLGGLGTFMSIITAAFITRASLMVVKKFRIT